MFPVSRSVFWPALTLEGYIEEQRSPTLQSEEDYIAIFKFLLAGFIGGL